MGAWGVQFTENDGALDFLGEVADSRDWAAVSQQLQTFVDDDEYEEAEAAFAACELVAAALGKASPHLEDELASWAVAHESEATNLRQLATKVANLIATESELNELWAEADEYAEWQASVENLKSRLG
jgi:hypothetical protein